LCCPHNNIICLSSEGERRACAHPFAASEKAFGGGAAAQNGRAPELYRSLRTGVVYHNYFRKGSIFWQKIYETKEKIPCLTEKIGKKMDKWGRMDKSGRKRGARGGSEAQLQLTH
jgi:hypothetical protein